MNQRTKRVFMSLCGVVICSVSIGIFKLAALGVDPFQSLMSGLDHMIPISFGTLYMIVNLILLSFALLTDRHYIGIATFINLFLLGYITQFSYALLQRIFPDPSLIFRFGCLLVAIVIICFGSALYMTADLGVSTYDAIALVCANKWKLGPFKYIRIITDLVCVGSGILVFLISGGELGMVPTFVGIGTIITAFFMGPLIDWFNRKFAIPLLNK
ncbi:MAG: hypothetical protein Q4B57_02430 [Eubacteriales bacterium]|nr:hypothetical protein [Eubacteriales bacterium]